MLVLEARELDVRRLGPQLWLNDSIINFFARVISMTLACDTPEIEFLIMTTHMFTLLR
jgi:Ulp1 family protease